jgi:hypothetical protein
MASPNVFALPESDLNGFLFSAIGTEQNGLSLTVLSTLARLGEDPWAQAASWASMSKDAASDALAACIAQMPLSPKDLQNAPATAARLVALLFRQSPAPKLASKIGVAPERGRFSPVFVAYLVIGIGTAAVLVSFLTTHGPIARWWEASQTDQKN